jgi:hypothetical protein
MRLNEINYTDALPIDGYGPGFFRVGGEVYNSAVLCSGAGVTEWGGYSDTETLLTLAGPGRCFVHWNGERYAACARGFSHRVGNCGAGR